MIDLRRETRAAEPVGSVARITRQGWDEEVEDSLGTGRLEPVDQPIGVQDQAVALLQGKGMLRKVSMLREPQGRSGALEQEVFSISAQQQHGRVPGRCRAHLARMHVEEDVDGCQEKALCQSVSGDLCVDTAQHVSRREYSATLIAHL